MPQFCFTDPYGLASVRVLFSSPVHQHVAAGAVMVRDVPFHSTGKPGSKHAYEGRFDACLGVKEMIVVGEVFCLEDPSSDFWQHTDANVVVVQFYNLILFVHNLVGHHIVERIGIDVTFGSLIDPSGEEDRIHLRVSNLVGWDNFFLNAHFYLLGKGRLREEQGREQSQQYKGCTLPHCYDR